MQEKSERRSNVARSEATRGVLIAAARALFAEKGYAETSTPEIVRAAGTTRGALYHHFADKAALFRAVLEQEYAAVEAEITQAAVGEPRGTVEALVEGGRGYLAAMQGPGRVRLMLLDGPAVLGRAALDEIDRRTSADSLRLGLEAAMAEGDIRALPLGPLTAVLSSMFERAALDVAEGAAPDDQVAVFEAIFRGLAP